MAVKKSKPAENLEQKPISSTKEIESTIINTIRESKDRSVEIFITSIFVCLGLVFYAMGYETILTLGVLLFGAMWNFFTSSNKFLAVIFAFLVCVPYALVSVAAGLYGQAFLHLLLYLPTQLIFYYQERKNVDNTIKKFNTMSYRVSLIIIAFAILLAFSIALVLYQIETQVLFWLDALAVVLLAVSMFLINGRFKFYWIQRLIAVFVACGLWITHGILFNWVEGSIMFALLFAMYLIVDTYKMVLWYKENYPKTERLAKKIAKLKIKDESEKETKKIIPSQKLPS